MSLQIYIGGEPYTAVDRVVTTPTPQTPFLSNRDIIIIAVAVGGGAVLVALVIIYLCVWWRMRGSVSRRKRGTKDRVKKVCRHFLVIEQYMDGKHAVYTHLAIKCCNLYTPYYMYV